MIAKWIYLAAGIIIGFVSAWIICGAYVRHYYRLWKYELSKVEYDKDFETLCKALNDEEKKK
jgi:hypothetical protein